MMQSITFFHPPGDFTVNTSVCHASIDRSVTRSTDDHTYWMLQQEFGIKSSAAMKVKVEVCSYLSLSDSYVFQLGKYPVNKLILGSDWPLGVKSIHSKDRIIHFAVCRAREADVICHWPLPLLGTLAK